MPKIEINSQDQEKTSQQTKQENDFSPEKSTSFSSPASSNYNTITLAVLIYGLIKADPLWLYTACIMATAYTSSPILKTLLRLTKEKFLPKDPEA